MAYDPNAAARPGMGIWGLPYSEAEAALVLLPVPWAPTARGAGAADGPRAILRASPQIDVFDGDVERPYAHGLHMLPIPSIELATFNDVQTHVEREVTRLLGDGKLVGIVGGAGSVVVGALVATGKVRGSSFGVLRFGARPGLHDALDQISAIETLVQVGVRAVSETQMAYLASQGARVAVFFDRDLSERKMAGEPFAIIAREIAASLPDDVWIAVDIDGLDPRYAPHTGTLVPGGLELAEAVAILREVVRANKRILGFGLCGVAPNPSDDNDEWDGNVGSRLLYKLAAFTLASQGIAQMRAR